MAAPLAAFLSVPGLEHVFMLVCKKGIHPLVHFKNDISAAASVTAVRSACRNVLFPPETDMAVAAFA